LGLQVIAVDVDDQKLALAREMGAAPDGQLSM
jgi:hypothetical protein